MVYKLYLNYSCFKRARQIKNECQSKNCTRQSYTGKEDYPRLLSQSEGGNRQNRLQLKSRTPSRAGLWTLSYVPCIYGKDIQTGKPDPFPSPPPPMKEPQDLYLDSPVA